MNKAALEFAVAATNRAKELMKESDYFVESRHKEQGGKISRNALFHDWVIARLAIIEVRVEKATGIKIPNNGDGQ